MERPWSTVAGLALGQTGPCAAPWARPKKIIMRWNPRKGIVSACWELKRKFRVRGEGIVKSVQVGTLMCLLSVGCLAQQPVPPSGTNANVVSIHTIDFRNFDYPANCWKDVDAYPKVINVSNGGWEKTLKNGSIIGFSLAKPVFGYVTGGPQEDAVVS